MSAKKVTRWETSDGATFKTQTEADAHEELQEARKHREFLPWH